MEIKSSHKHHTGRKGEKGGSLPSIHNNHVSACTETLAKAQEIANAVKSRLPNPVDRLKK